MAGKMRSAERLRTIVLVGRCVRRKCDDPQHVEWVKSQRDPELWHTAAIALVDYRGDPRGFLVCL
jgi:hypothetical protein